MSAFDEYFTALHTKLQGASEIADTDNVTFGESVDIEYLKDSDFPRLETLIVKLKCDGYESQRNQRWAIRYGIAGYFRTTTDNMFPTLAEVNRAVNFGKEVVDLNYQFLDDKQAGSPPCTGFEQLGHFPEIFVEKELIPSTMAFIAFIEASVLIPDTETL